MFRYNLYHLKIESEIELPCDSSRTWDGPKEITIRAARGSTNEFGSIAYASRKYGGLLRSYSVDGGLLYCPGPRIKIFIHENGKEIWVDADPSDYQEAALSVSGVALSVLLIFRGYVPIHASCVQLNGCTYAIIADSGVGKSTLTWNLLRNGAGFLCDDVSPICSQEAKMSVIPSVSLNSKLWKSSIDQLGMDYQKFTPILPDMDKYHVPVRGEQRVTSPQEINALLLLNPFEETENQQATEVTQITGSSLLPLLLEHTHSIWTMPDLLQQYLFPSYVKIIKSIPVYCLRYKRNFVEMGTLIETIKSFSHRSIKV
ncbi:hypothetical protein PA598K_03660 [Paenibacillus sp. 598K]|nr:hypothetical protein PA598K_03660 [Paenibacillus sp. 598K]